MATIDTRPLGKLLDAQPVSALRIVLGTIFGLGILIGGTVLFLIINLGLVWVVICAVTIVSLIVYALVKDSLVRRRVIREFAEINGLVPLTEDTTTSLLPPSLQNIGSNRKFNNGYIMRVDNQSVYLFDYSFEILAEGRHGYKRYSLAIVQSQKSYPHIYLDGRQNNRNDTYKAWQKLTLEGDFNKYFDLYADENTNIETLSFLTPDVMQRFIDTARLYDVETYNQNLAIITAGTSIYVKTNMERLLVCLRAILSKVPASSTLLTTNAATPYPVLKKRNRTVSYIIGYVIAAIIIAFSFYLSSK